eukprot:Selendium_serpulae@DN3278_c0_g1_i1.p1
MVAEKKSVAAATEKKDKEKEKEKEATPPPPSPQDLTYAELLKLSLDLVHTGSLQKDAKHVARMIRHFTLLRRKAKPAPLIKALTKILGSSPNFALLSNAIKQCRPVKAEEITTMDDGEATAEKEKEKAKLEKAKEEKEKEEKTEKTDKEKDKEKEKEKEKKDRERLGLPEHMYSASLIEQEVLLSTLTLVYLIDRGYDKTKTCEVSEAIVERLKVVNKRYLDQIIAKAYFYYARAHELAGRLKGLRYNMLAAFRTATLHQDLMTQATLLNLMLRELMQSEDHDVAMRLVKNAKFPEGLRSNVQYARYLYYLGRLQALSLDYSEAHTMLMQAIRKAPQGPAAGRGFRTSAYKLAIVVELLMGDIPERQIFDEKEMRVPLAPYRAVVLAVRGGDLAQFKAVTDKYNQVFNRDGTMFLIQRLHHNVIRAGLRTINLSYSRITLTDVAKRLGLGPESDHDVECIVSKAVLDGVMEATIDHDQQAVCSKGNVDVYTSTEPTTAFHKRIEYCLHLHDDAVKAMQYLEDVVESKTAENQARRKETQEQLMRAEEEDSEDDQYFDLP